MKINSSKTPSGFEKMSSLVTKASGSTSAFIMALLIIVVWLISGPIFKYSDTWQLVINTGTTIVTFLMVFLIQRSQNKDSVSLHLKLNELIIAQELASNRLVSVEDICEDDLITLKNYYARLALMAQQELSVEESHSLGKADVHHNRKKLLNNNINRQTNTNTTSPKTNNSSNNTHTSTKNIPRSAPQHSNKHTQTEHEVAAVKKENSGSESRKGNNKPQSTTAPKVVATVESVSHPHKATANTRKPHKS